eukprot:9040-Heterococcus_DN1.PRE.1
MCSFQNFNSDAPTVKTDAGFHSAHTKLLSLSQRVVEGVRQELEHTRTLQWHAVARLQLLRPCIPDVQLLLLHYRYYGSEGVHVCVLLRVERECISVKKLDCGFMHHRDQRWIPGGHRQVNSVLTGLEAHFRADPPVSCNYSILDNLIQQYWCSVWSQWYDTAVCILLQLQSCACGPPAYTQYSAITACMRTMHYSTQHVHTTLLQYTMTYINMYMYTCKHDSVLDANERRKATVISNCDSQTHTQRASMHQC